jgi:hypothetical protein
MNHPEADLQVQVADILRLYQDPRKFVFTSAPNELMGSARSGAGLARMARFRKMGMRAGWADLTIIRDGKAYLLELKTPTGTMSEKQKTFRTDAIAAGAEYAVARTLEQAVSALALWGMIP